MIETTRSMSASSGRHAAVEEKRHGMKTASMGFNIQSDEMFFLLSALFFLYCYVRVLRKRAYFGSVGAGDFTGALHRAKRMSGLTSEEIEKRLRSYTVRVTATAEDTIVCFASCEYGKILFERDDCAICLEGFDEDGAKVRQLRCEHVFHQECIDDWLQRRNKCPCCLARAC